MDNIAKILADLAQLHADGHLTDAEFAAAKEEALGRRIPQLGPSAAPGTSAARSEPSDDHAMPWNWRRIPDFRSRSRRSEWWATWAIAWAVLFVGFVVAGLLTPDNPAVIVWLSVAVFLGLYWGVSVNRLHDLGMRGWWVPAMLVPLLGLWIFILLASKEGDPGSNRWGDPIGSAVLVPEATVAAPTDPRSSAAPNVSEPAFGAMETDTSDDTWSLSLQLWVGAGVVFVIAAALGIYMFTNNGNSDSTGALPTTTSSSVTQTTAPANAPTSTLSTREMKGFDAQVRDFLIVVDKLETNDRYTQATVSDNWWIYTDEYPALSQTYLDLAEQWDRTYSERVENTDPGFGQLVSHALIRRSDGYRLVAEANTPEAVDEDIDSMLYSKGVEAIEEASGLFAEVWSDIPGDWQPDTGISGSALDEIKNVDLPKPDPIPYVDLVVGDCYENPPPSDPVYSLDRVNCSPGALFVYWTEDIGVQFEGWPGEEHVSEYVGQLCRERANARFPFMDLQDAGPWWTYALADSWEVGDSGASCSYKL